MAYVYLVAAILSEVAATTCLKSSDGFSKLLPSLGVVVGYVTAFALLGQTLKTVPVSVAYALWSAMGTALIAAIGITLMGEPVTILTIVGLGLIIVGVVTLHLGGAG